jgi:lipopolysaccharide export system protein LptA
MTGKCRVRPIPKCGAMADDSGAFDRATGELRIAIARGSRWVSLRRQALISLLMAFLLLLPWSPVRAANIAAPADNRPISVTAETGIEWQKQAQVYVARGNAVATRGPTQVRADTLTAHYRPGKGVRGANDVGGNEVYRLDADRHVVISNGANTVIGDQAVYDVGQEIAVITGSDLRLTTSTDVVTARDSFEWYDQQQLAVARGNAVAVRGDRRIRADVLTAHMIKNNPPSAAKPEAAATTAKPAAGAPPTRSTAAAAKPSPPTAAEDENSRISRIDAQGHVVVSTPTDIGRGDFGVYDAIKGFVTLLGNVTITRGPNLIRGQYAVVDLNTNVSRMMTLAATPGQPAPRVEGIFVRQDATSQPSGPGVTGTNVGTTAKKP